MFPITGAMFYGVFFDRMSNRKREKERDREKKTGRGKRKREKHGECYTGLSIKINDICAPAARLKTR